MYHTIGIMTTSLRCKPTFGTVLATGQNVGAPSCDVLLLADFWRLGCGLLVQENHLRAWTNRL